MEDIVESFAYFNGGGYQIRRIVHFGKLHIQSIMRRRT